MALKEPGDYYVGGVPGLYLQVSSATVRSWILRVSVDADGKNVRRECGLGGYPGVTLAEARDKARALRAGVAAGHDPIKEKMATKKAAAAVAHKKMTFATAAELLIERKKGEWKNIVHYHQWISTLTNYAYPIIGSMPVADVETQQIVEILEPIWSSKTETATRLRSRIEMILDSAIVTGFRDRENPARWKGHLDKILPNPSKVAKKGNHPALPFERIPEFMNDLRGHDIMSAKALEFLILTAARTQEVLCAKWSEIDFDASIWILCKKRMKVGKEHRVPLAPGVMEQLNNLGTRDNEFIFPSQREQPLSNVTLIALCRRMSDDAVSQGRVAYVDSRQNNRVITPHGFRSTFRDWISETTDYSHDVAEMALSHTIKSQTEAAYRRRDVLEKRRSLMLDWYNYCQPTFQEPKVKSEGVLSELIRGLEERYSKTQRERPPMIDAFDQIDEDDEDDED